MYSSICQVGGSKDHLAAAMEHAKTAEAAAQLEAEQRAAGGNGHRQGKECF